MEELDMAIRLFNRKKAVEKLEKEARVVMIKLKERIEDLGMTMTEVFEEMDTSGDGVLSGQELMEGLSTISSGKKERADTTFDEKFAAFLQATCDIIMLNWLLIAALSSYFSPCIEFCRYHTTKR